MTLSARQINGISEALLENLESPGCHLRKTQSLSPDTQHSMQDHPAYVILLCLCCADGKLVFLI